MRTKVSHNSIGHFKLLTTVNIIDDLFALCFLRSLAISRRTKWTRHRFSTLSSSLSFHLPVSLPVPLLLFSFKSSPDGLVDDPFAREFAGAGVESVELTDILRSKYRAKGFRHGTRLTLETLARLPASLAS